MQSAAIYMAAFSLMSIHLSNALSSISLGLCCLLLLVSIPVSALKNAGLVLPLLLIVQVLIQSIFHSWDLESWQSIQVKLVLLFGPWFMASYGSLKARNSAIFFVALFMAWISIAAVINYFADLQFWNEMVSQSKPIAIYSKIYHIEYSFILSLVAISCFYIEKLPKPLNVKHLRLLGILLSICLHVLSTRTGLLAFYVGLIPLFIVKYKNLQFKSRIIMVGAMIIFLFTISLIPSIQHRLKNSISDLNTVIKSEKVNNQSFGQRYVSWNAGVKLIQSKTLRGYGISNANSALKKEIAEGEYAIDTYYAVAPHNIYLEMALQSGVISPLLYILFLVLSMIFAYLKQNAYLMGIILSIMLASNFETLIERQAGVLAMMLFVLFAARVKSVEQKLL